MIHTLLISTLLLTGASAQNADAGEPLIAQGLVNAPVRDVWDAWTTRDGVLAWQLDNASEIEMKIGATWRTSYDPDSDLNDDTIIENEVLAFDPLRMFAVRTVRAPADFPFPNAILDCWTVLYLEPVNEDQTRVEIRMFGFTDSAESQEMRMFFEWGNQYEVDRLGEYFDSRDRP